MVSVRSMCCISNLVKWDRDSSSSSSSSNFLLFR